MRASLVIFVCAALTVATSLETDENRAKWANECMEKFITDKNWKFEGFENAPKETKCMVNCYMEKTGLMRGGKPNVDQFMAEAEEVIKVIHSEGYGKVDVKRYRQGVEKCSLKAVGGTCERSFMMQRCASEAFQKSMKMNRKARAVSADMFFTRSVPGF